MIDDNVHAGCTSSTGMQRGEVLALLSPRISVSETTNALVRDDWQRLQPALGGSFLIKLGEQRKASG